MKIPATQYARVLMQISEGKSGQELESTVRDFVAVLAERHEMSRWREVIRALDHVWKETYGVANVKLQTAHPASELLKQTLASTFKDASIQTETNSELIGGAILQIDDRRIDGSVSGQLERLERSLANS